MKRGSAQCKRRHFCEVGNKWNHNTKKNQETTQSYSEKFKIAYQSKSK